MPSLQRTSTSFAFEVLLIGFAHAQLTIQMPSIGSLVSSQTLGTTPLLSTEPIVQNIYKNGLADGWRDASWGCNCTFDDTDPADVRSPSKSVITTHVDPFCAIVLESTKAFTANSALSFWMRGSGMTAFSLYMEDTSGRRYSKDVRLSTANQLDDAVVYVHGADDQGWVQLQVTLSKLVDATDAKSLLSPTTFNRLVFRDRSGGGFNLQLDDIKLVSQSTLSSFNAASISDSLILPTLTMPVFGTDLLNSAAGPDRYIMRLKAGVSFQSVNAICSELAGKFKPITGLQRFSGFCDNSTFNWLTSGTSALTSSVDWRFVSFSVDSAASLNAMRSALGGQAEYIERDLVSSVGRHLSFTETQSTAHPGDVPMLQTAQMDASAAAASTADAIQRTTAAIMAAVRAATTGTSGTSGAVAYNSTTAVAYNVTAAATPGSAAAGSPQATSKGNSSAQPHNDATGTSSIAPANNTGDATGMSSIVPVNNTGTAMNGTSNVGTGSSNATDDGTSSIQPVNNMGVSETSTIALSVRSWGIDRLDQVNLPLDGVYNPGNLDGRGVHVFVLDTGCRATHLAFRGRLSDSVSMVSNTFNDGHGHGTHVTATACGSVYGVAQSCIIHCVKVFDDTGAGSNTNVINGMRWVKNYKANNNIQSAVVSMSLSGQRSAALNDAVSDLVAAGITVVVAAGNDNRGDACSVSPASASGAIVVGSTTDTDALSSFSNIGSCVTVFAPGSLIVSAGISSDSAEATKSGTSMATPHVSGAAVLYLQAFPGASPATVKAGLLAAAVGKQIDTSSPTKLANVLATRLRGTTATAPSPSPTPAPTAPVPAPTPTITLPSVGFGSLFGSAPSFCASCPWCMFCK